MATLPPLPDLLLPKDDRAALARAITRVESKRADHQAQARKLLTSVMDRTGDAQRIGITGVPGVGKSTFIDAFGTMLTAIGRKVAVLAVDPTSRRTGGSILGDKTRMARLSVDPAAFVRPSPAGGTLGGVARKTRETIFLCEAAGYDVILVETVGVGQSETMVAEMVDFFMVLMLPNAGDELQGIKKGVLEIADLIAVNKADVDRDAAERAARHYRNALHILDPEDPDWSPPVTLCAGLSGEGLPELWETIGLHRKKTEANGRRMVRRAGQQVRWLDDLVSDGLRASLEADQAVRKLFASLRQQVAETKLPASVAADEVLRAFLRR